MCLEGACCRSTQVHRVYRGHTDTACCWCSLRLWRVGDKKGQLGQPFNLCPDKATLESHHTGSWDNGSKPGHVSPCLPVCKIPGSCMARSSGWMGNESWPDTRGSGLHLPSIVSDPGKDPLPGAQLTQTQQARNAGKLWGRK